MTKNQVGNLKNNGTVAQNIGQRFFPVCKNELNKIYYILYIEAKGW